MTDKPFLLIAGGLTTQALWPLLAQDYDLVFLYPQAAQFAREAGLAVASLSDIINEETQEVIANEAALLTAKLVNAMPVVDERMQAAYAEVELPASLKTYRDWFAGYGSHHFRQAIGRLIALQKVLALRPIAGCVVHEDVSPDTRSMVQWCNSRAIKTIHVPHQPCHMLVGIDDIHKETRATWILASGEYMRDFYIEAGHPADKIEIAGGPQWDSLYYSAFPTRSEARQVLKLPEDQRAIHYASTWQQSTSLLGHIHEIDDGLNAVMQLAIDQKAVVMITIHPNDGNTEEIYVRALEAARVPGLVTRQHINYILAAADVTITQGPSNLAIQAAVMGTPVCYIQTEGFDFRHELPPRGSADMLPNMVDEAILLKGDPRWQDFITYYNAAHPDGGASEKIVEYIQQVING